MKTLIQRRRPLKIFLFRLLFIFSVLLIIELLRRGINDYATFSILIFVFLLFPSITELSVFLDRVHIKKYFLLATITKSYNINCDSRLQISTFNTEIESDTDAYLFSDSILSFLPVFLTPKTTFKYYKFKFSDKGIEKKLTVRLTEEEYKQFFSGH